VNATIDGWEEDTDFINRKYISPAQAGRSQHCIFDFAKQGENSIGYTIVRPEIDDKDTAYLAFIAVKRDHQKNGGRLYYPRAYNRKS
jgi:hypothetical protein